MYLKNLLNITGTLPVKKSELLNQPATPTEFKIISFDYAGSRSPIAAFLLLMVVFLTVACSDPSPVGDGLNNDNDEVITQEFDLDEITTTYVNTYSGRLENTSMGYVNDPLYGTLQAIALLKPSISTSEVDSIGEDDVISLKLVFTSEVYGDESSTATYELYEPAELWRGRELRYNQSTIQIDQNSKVGEFQVGSEDSVEVELSPEWVEKYLDVYNAPSAERDSLLRNEFRGLAIVPAETNSRLHFLKHRPDEDEDSEDLILESATSLLVTSPATDNEDEVVRAFSMRDWGTSFEKSDEPDNSDKILLYNTGRILKITPPDLNPEDLEGSNIVSAQLLISADSSSTTADPSFVRPKAEVLRIHQFINEPTDLGAEIFDRSANYGSGRNEDDDALFNIDITDYVLNNLFGGNEDPILYLSIQGDNGILYNTEIYNQDGPENRKPRLIITYVKSDS